MSSISSKGEAHKIESPIVIVLLLVYERHS